MGSKSWVKINLSTKPKKLTDLWLRKRRDYGGGKDWESEVSRWKLLHIQQINHKFLLDTRYYIQYPVINLNGKKYFKRYMCVAESLCCIAEINTTLYIITTSIKNKFY